MQFYIQVDMQIRMQRYSKQCKNPSNMTKFNAFETEYERFLRERAENVEREYLNYANEILAHKVSPNRIIKYLADRFSMSGEGIKTILKRRGVYKSAEQPVFIKKATDHQTTLPFVGGTINTEANL